MNSFIRLILNLMYIFLPTVIGLIFNSFLVYYANSLILALVFYPITKPMLYNSIPRSTIGLYTDVFISSFVPGLREFTLASILEEVVQFKDISLNPKALALLPFLTLLIPFFI